MARRRFFVEEIRRGKAELTGADAEHLVRVLRVEPGQIFELSDNHKVYLAEVETARKSLVSFSVNEELPSPASAVHTILLPALFKFDHFEWLVEKATELEVAEILPFEAVRSEHGLFQASQKRRARWQRIGLEASQQSRRARLPEIGETLRFAAAIRTQADVNVFLDEAYGTKPLLDVLLAQERKQGQRVAVLLGPEGGWTDEERQQVTEAGWLATSLGSTILRAETAGIAALSIVNAAWAGLGATV